MEEKIKGILESIKYLGHSGFLLDLQKKIYIDPYQIKGELPVADIILATHPHFDHLSPEDIEKISGNETVVITTPDGLGKVRNAKPIRPGEEIDIEGIKIKAVPAYNQGKTFHTRSSGWVGYVVEVDGVRIYHAGDTDFIPEMKDIDCNIALLPVSGTYVMTAEEAVEAARMIKPDIAIPMHYGVIVGSINDAEKFKRLLEGEVEVVILETV